MVTAVDESSIAVIFGRLSNRNPFDTVATCSRIANGNAPVPADGSSQDTSINGFPNLCEAHRTISNANSRGVSTAPEAGSPLIEEKKLALISSSADAFSPKAMTTLGLYLVPPIRGGRRGCVQTSCPQMGTKATRALKGPLRDSYGIDGSPLSTVSSYLSLAFSA